MYLSVGNCRALKTVISSGTGVIGSSNLWTWVLGTELRLSLRSASTLNGWPSLQTQKVSKIYSTIYLTTTKKSRSVHLFEQY